MKIRKSVKYTTILIAIVLIIFACFNIVNTVSSENSIKKNKEVYSYKNKFNYDYSVDLKDNKYIDEKNLDASKKNYITDLIDNINLDLNYDYVGSTESKIEYTYKIIGQLNGVYTTDNEEMKIWEKEYVLKDEMSNTETSDHISISESLALNLSEQNDLVKSFQEEMGFSIDANYVVKLIVDIKTEVKGKEIVNRYVSSVTMDLAKKVTEIRGNNNVEEENFIAKEYTDEGSINYIALVVYIVIIIVAVFMFISVIGKESTTVVKDRYRQELNRILKICQEKIVQASSNPIAENSNVIEVKDFSEMIKVSEELFKPILYWFCQETDEAQFCVISNNMVYRYILKK